MSFKDLMAGLEKELMKDQGSSTTGLVQYLKSGSDHHIKFVMPKGKTWNPDGDTEECKFWVPFEDKDKDGQPCTRYLVPGVIVSADDDKAVDTENIKYIKVTATALKLIMAQLAAGHDLFDDEGPVLNCKPLKAQPWFSVSAIPQKKSWKIFDSSGCAYPDISIEEAAKAESAKAGKPPTKSDKIVIDDESLPF